MIIRINNPTENTENMCGTPGWLTCRRSSILNYSSKQPITTQWKNNRRRKVRRLLLKFTFIQIGLHLPNQASAQVSEPFRRLAPQNLLHWRRAACFTCSQTWNRMCVSTPCLWFGGSEVVRHVGKRKTHTVTFRLIGTISFSISRKYI